MLTQKQKEALRRQGSCTWHDHWFVSIFAGEPHLKQGVLSYYDGRLVTMCGFPLRGEPAIEASIIRELAAEWASNAEVQSICYVGPQTMRLTRLRRFGFRKVAQQPPIGISSELFLNCNGAPGSVFKKRVYRRSCSLGFKSQVRTGGTVSAEHFKLIEQFYRQREVSTYLAEIAFALPVLLRSRRVSLVEARKNGVLCGFIALHKPFSDVAVGLFMARQEDMPGVCDFLYSAMLDESRELGATSVNVGPSPTVGHYNFKKKWGGEPVIAPYYYVQWARGALAQRTHTSWGPRMIRL